MRYSRQNKIIELIENNEIDTQEKLAALNERKERLEEIAVKQLRIRLKSALGAPEAERALLCKQKKSGHYRHSKTKRSSN